MKIIQTTLLSLLISTPLVASQEDIMQNENTMMHLTGAICVGFSDGIMSIQDNMVEIGVINKEQHATMRISLIKQQEILKQTADMYVKRLRDDYAYSNRPFPTEQLQAAKMEKVNEARGFLIAKYQDFVTALKEENETMIDFAGEDFRNSLSTATLGCKNWYSTAREELLQHKDQPATPEIDG